VTYQRLCVWSGPVFLGFFFIGMVVVAQLLPPPSAAASAQTIAAFYGARTGEIRAGLLIALTSCAFYLPWVAIVSAHMKRIENVSPALVIIQALGGAVGTIAFMVPILIWLTASFRPERDPEITRTLNDLGWVIFTIGYPPFEAQLVSFALAVIGDKAQKPVLPSWVGYLALSTGVSFFPAVLITYLKTGPFSYTGFIGLWLPLIMFGAWLCALTILLLKATREEEKSSARP